MKRIPAERLDALVRLHREANYNIIRNWVGQSTSEDFFAACDKYGIMVWDEFFEANPNNGRDPDSPDLYLANVRDTVLRYRNHPSIVIWCGRNERPTLAARHCRGQHQASAGARPAALLSGQLHRGQRRHLRRPLWLATAALILRQRAEPGVQNRNRQRVDPHARSHPGVDAAKGLVRPKLSQRRLGRARPRHRRRATRPTARCKTSSRQRYGPYASLPEFVRKAQMADYETYRAMYESHLSKMFAPCTAAHHLDEQPSPALPRLADLRLLAGAVRLLLRRAEGLRAGARHDDAGQFPR